MSQSHNERSEALFEELSRKKKKRRNRIICTVVAVLVVLAIVLISAISIMTKRVQDRFQSAGTDVLNYTAGKGTISTVVSGSGTLTEVDLQELKVPSGVEIVEILVETDDAVSKGDVLALVDMSTVMSALADIQADIDELDDQIGDAKGAEVSSTIRAGIGGRVKIIHGEADMSVASCIARHGVLAVLSLDGYMAVDIQTGSLARGDSVIVVRENGSEISGKVESVSAGVATILVSDDGPRYDEEVRVKTETAELGAGRLYIHSPLGVTGYAGTVRSVPVSENQKVYSGTVLFTLKDTSTSASYDTLLRQRAEKEAVLVELMTIYRDGAILAPMDGIVSSIPYGAEEEVSSTAALYLYGATPAAASESEDPVLLSLYPDVRMSVTIPIDETDILALRIGQTADVEISSISTDTIYSGTVTEVSKTASLSTGITQYSAVITLEKVRGMLPGMTASVDIRIEGVEDTIIIPVDALHQTSTISFVYTSYDPETQQYGGMVEVTTGMRNDEFVEITSGLKIGDVVYYVEARKSIFDFFGGGYGGQTPGGYGGQMPGRFGG